MTKAIISSFLAYKGLLKYIRSSLARDKFGMPENTLPYFKI